MLILALALQALTTCNKLFETTTCRTYGDTAPVIPLPETRAKSLPRFDQRISTSRELYIGCYLYGNAIDVPNEPNNLAPFSATACMLTAGSVYQKTMAQPVEQRAFCPPSQVSKDLPLREMASAYSKLYEAMPAGKEGGNSYAVMMAAAITLWPCTDRYRSKPR